MVSVTEVMTPARLSAHRQPWIMQMVAFRTPLEVSCRLAPGNLTATAAARTKNQLELDRLDERANGDSDM